MLDKCLSIAIDDMRADPILRNKCLRWKLPDDVVLDVGDSIESDSWDTFYMEVSHRAYLVDENVLLFDVDCLELYDSDHPEYKSMPAVWVDRLLEVGWFLV